MRSFNRSACYIESEMNPSILHERKRIEKEICVAIVEGEDEEAIGVRFAPSLQSLLEADNLAVRLHPFELAPERLHSDVHFVGAAGTYLVIDENSGSFQPGKKQVGRCEYSFGSYPKSRHGPPRCRADMSSAAVEVVRGMLFEPAFDCRREGNPTSSATAATETPSCSRLAAPSTKSFLRVRSFWAAKTARRARPATASDIGSATSPAASTTKSTRSLASSTTAAKLRPASASTGSSATDPAGTTIRLGAT